MIGVRVAVTTLVTVTGGGDVAGGRNGAGVAVRVACGASVIVAKTRGNGVAVIVGEGATQPTTAGCATNAEMITPPQQQPAKIPIPSASKTCANER